MLSLRSNIASTSAQRNLNAVSSLAQRSLERLSSGFRINRAGDDAAGLAISERLKAQVAGLMQAARNARDGVSMIETAESGLAEIQNMMQRMRALAIAASNDTVSTGERMNIGQELEALRREASDVATRTRFNGIRLLAGELSASVAAGSDLQQGQVTPDTGVTIVALDVSGAAAGRTYAFSRGPDAGFILTDTVTGQAQYLPMVINNPAAGWTCSVNFDRLGISLRLFEPAVAVGGFLLDGHTITTAASGGRRHPAVGRQFW